LFLPYSCPFKKKFSHASLFLFIFRINGILCSSSLFLALWVAREPALLPIHGILFCADVNEREVVVPELFSDYMMCTDCVRSMCMGVILFKRF
jgi:hypothetical protein